MEPKCLLGRPDEDALGHTGASVASTPTGRWISWPWCLIEEQEEYFEAVSTVLLARCVKLVKE